MSTAAPRFELGSGDWGMLLLLALIWGCSFFFIAVSVEAIPPLTLAALRIVLAAVSLWLVLAASGRLSLIPRGMWVWFAIMGVLNNVVPFTLIIYSQLDLPAGLAAIVIATTPLQGVIVAGFTLADERLTAGRIVGALAGLTGIVLIIGIEAFAGAGGKLPALVACLLGALSLAIAGVYGRRFAGAGVPPLASATAQVSASSVILVPIAMVVDRPWQLALPGAEIWAAVFALGVLSTALAYVLYFRVLASAGATSILLVNLLVPLPAIFLGIAFLGETLLPGHFVGLALIGLGLLAVDGRLARSLGARRRVS